MDDGQKLRNPLNLVDHHRVFAGRSREQLQETLGARIKTPMQRGIEQVQVQGIGEPIAQPSPESAPVQRDGSCARPRHPVRGRYRGRVNPSARRRVRSKV